MISKTRKYHSQSLKYGLADKISYVMRNNLFLYSKKLLVPLHSTINIIKEQQNDHVKETYANFFVI